jgi:hypothetical protein
MIRRRRPVLPATKPGVCYFLRIHSLGRNGRAFVVIHPDRPPAGTTPAQLRRQPLPTTRAAFADDRHAPRLLVDRDRRWNRAWSIGKGDRSAYSGDGTHTEQHSRRCKRREIPGIRRRRPVLPATKPGVCYVLPIHSLGRNGRAFVVFDPGRPSAGTTRGRPRPQQRRSPDRRTSRTGATAPCATCAR